MTRLNHPEAFWTALRQGNLLGPTLSTDEVDGTNALLAAMGDDQWGLPWTAYGLATAYHETAHTMLPVSERGGDAYFTRLYDIRGQRPEMARSMENTSPGDGIRYRGRGYAQLTWKRNYRVMGARLGLPLVANPDMAMKPAVAARVLVTGMREGLFTGMSLKRALPGAAAGFKDYVRARKIINGQDRAEDIATYAGGFARALVAEDWE